MRTRASPCHGSRRGAACCDLRGWTPLDHVTNAIRGARADEPQREVDDEADEREPEDRHREADEAPKNSKDQLETQPCQNRENGETQNAPEHDCLRGARCVCSVRLNVAQSLDRKS